MSEGPAKSASRRSVGWLMITGYGVIVDEDARRESEQAKTTRGEFESTALDDPDHPMKPGKDFY